MYLILLIGHTGQGKTTFLNTEFLKNVVAKNPANTQKNIYSICAASKKQYIFDVNNEYMLPNDIRTSNFMRHTECDINRFIEVSKNIRGYNIVIEDATGFLRGRQSATFARLLTGKIHTQNNFIILFHSINRVPPELMEMANFVVLFKTVDNIDSLKKFKNEKLTHTVLELQKKQDYAKEIIKLI